MSRPARGKVPFIVHYIDAAGVKQAVSVPAHTPDAAKAEIRALCSCANILKVKVDRSGEGG